ncbi:MAG TPA: hypothetical protein PLM62_15595 [Zoogloea sp.]|nr:hypothetical protein [Zoogloea sp.]
MESLISADKVVGEVVSKFRTYEIERSSPRDRTAIRETCGTRLEETWFATSVAFYLLHERYHALHPETLPKMTERSLRQYCADDSSSVQLRAEEIAADGYALDAIWQENSAPMRTVALEAPALWTLAPVFLRVAATESRSWDLRSTPAVGRTRSLFNLMQTMSKNGDWLDRVLLGLFSNILDATEVYRNAGCSCSECCQNHRRDRMAGLRGYFAEAQDSNGLRRFDVSPLQEEAAPLHAVPPPSLTSGAIAGGDEQASKSVGFAVSPTNGDGEKAWVLIVSPACTDFPSPPFESARAYPETLRMYLDQNPGDGIPLGGVFVSALPVDGIPMDQTTISDVLMDIVLLLTKYALDERPELWQEVGCCANYAWQSSASRR